MAVLTFKNPPYSQIASPLLQLPTEVLLIILRLLHSSPTGIVKSEGAHYSLTYDLNVQLSSQLLRCCQRLHIEGGRVLYTENTLNITFGLRQDKYEEDHGLVHCFMFDTAIRIPQHGLEIPQDQFDLLSWAYLSEERQQPITWNYDHARLDRYKYGAALRFAKVEVSIDFWDIAKLFIVCRILQGLVRSKEVEVVASGFDVEVLDSLHENAYAFSCWHCSSITFGDFDGDNTNAVADLIKNPRPIFDGLPMAQEIHRFLTVDPGISFLEEGLEQYDANDDVANLWSAVWLHDSTSFKENKDAILEKAMVSESQYWKEPAETMSLVKELICAAADRQRRANKTSDEAHREKKRDLEERLELELARIARKKADSYSMIGALLTRDP